MKLLYFMVLLIFGANADLNCSTSTGNARKIENYFVYCNSNLTITENLTALLCNWGSIQCYVECTPGNITTNVTGVLNTTRVVETNINNESKVVDFTIRGQEITCNVTKCRSAGIRALIIESSNRSYLNDLLRPLRIRYMCTNLFSSDIGIKKAYIRAEKIYIDFLIRSPFNGTTKNFDFEEFNMNVINMDMMNTKDLGLLQISAPQVPGDDPLINVFIPTETFVNVPLDQHKVGVVTYPSTQLFINDPNTVLRSNVIRVETVGSDIKHLTKRLIINFTVKSSQVISENHTMSCRFYNVDADIPAQEWDDTGSFTNLDNFNSSNIVNCSYDHMTPFAVLLVNVSKIDPWQWEILSYLSYIGCSLSAFFSAITIFIYTFMKSLNRDSSIHIHVSLSIALFLLNTSFLFIEWGATWSQESLCVLIAVIIQYSLLSSFSWMVIEAVHVYLLLIKVFNTYIKHYMVKLSLFGWGVPAVFVGGSLCVFGSMPFYGTVKIQLSNTNKITQFCWITDHRFLYGMNITYFSLTFLFNTSILVAVTHQIFKLRRLNVRGSKLPMCKDVCTVLGLSMLLGMTWGLAFFTSGYTNYPILYLFCIFNTLQGLFLFLWFYGTIKKNRRLMAQTSTTSEPANTTVNTHESSFSY